jgi:hypothetical protein
MNALLTLLEDTEKEVRAGGVVTVETAVVPEEFWGTYTYRLAQLFPPTAQILTLSPPEAAADTSALVPLTLTVAMLGLELEFT